MTVSSTTVKNSYSGNGSTTQFAYGYKIFADSDLIVIIRVNSTGTETVKTLTTHYTVAGAGDASGGSITFTSGNTPASGETVVIIREVPQTQAIDYIANDPFPAESHEEGLDRGTMTTQQVQEEVDRSLKLSRTNTMTSTEFTVGATDRANKVLSFDSSGELSVTQELGTFRGNWGASTAYQVRDIVKDTSTNNIFIATVAHTSSGSQPLTTNTDSAKWSLIVDAASSTTSQNAAAASATASANSATASANSATASANSATASANSATASANSATASGNSATASANSATASAASFDSFDDRYLGAKSSNPSTDNDGNALLTGAIYFNTSTNQIFSWTGSAWTAIKPTSSEQTNINALAASAVIADMAILGTTDVVNDMNILATNDVVTDMNVLATSDVVTDMNTLGTADVVNDMNVLGSSATVTAMNLLGTSAVVTDMGILGTADVVTDMNVLATADVVADMNTLGTAAIVADMAILGTNDVVADMAILATSDIVTDMNVLGTSANVTAMNTLGTSTNVTNMATVSANIAGVNSFADRYRVVSSNPTSSLDAGDLAFVTGDSNLKFYNGSSWVSIAPGIANVVDDSTPQLGGNLDLNSKNITGTGNISTTGTATFTTADNSNTLSLVSTDADANAGPILSMRRESGSPADNDLIGQLDFIGKDSGGVNTQYASIKGIIKDVTNNTEDGALEFVNFKGGFLNNALTLGNTETVFNDASVDIDFRVESNGDANMLFVDGGNNRVGIGTSTPLATLQIESANSGVSPSANADELFIENNANAGLTIGTSTSGVASIFFADSADPARGRIRYDQSNDAMTFGTAGLSETGRYLGNTFMVGKTSASGASNGVELKTNDESRFTQTARTVVAINRLSSDGNIVEFKKDNTTVGVIGSQSWEITSSANHPNLNIRSTITPNGSKTGGQINLSLGSGSNSGSGNADTQAGDKLGQINFNGQGTDFSYQGAFIDGLVTTGDGDDVRANQGVAMAFGVKPVGSSGYGEKMRLSSTGFLGIGETAPLGVLHAKSADSGASVNGGHNQVIAENSANSGMSILSGTSSNGAICFGDSGNNCIGYVNYAHNGNHLSFGANGNERMRIDSAGRILINTTSHIGTSPYLNIANTYTNSGMAIKSNTAVAHHAIEFHNTNGQVGSINTLNSGTQYNTSSDYRLKENVSYDFDATTRLKQLRPARFNFIADADTTVDGFIAHEVQSVVPEAIHGTHNEVDGDGNPKYQGIDQSKLVPLLVKTIQELEARITTLEANN